MATDPARPTICVTIETRAILTEGARVQPAVSAADWDAQAYARERAQLWREALASALAERGVALQVAVDLDGPALCGAARHTLRLGGDTITITARDDEAQALLAFVTQAARSVVADHGGWRRFLHPGWFERHRSWRLEVGSPIQH
jgi:hypothetical protein